MALYERDPTTGNLTLISGKSLAFTGATANADGVAGEVPQPLAGQQNYVLQGGGNWSNRLDVNKADKSDLTSIFATGSTNTTGATIASGTFFYLDGVLVRAKSDIASNASFTLNTNYEIVTAGGLNELIPSDINFTLVSSITGLQFYYPQKYRIGNICHISGRIQRSGSFSSSAWTKVGNASKAPKSNVYGVASAVNGSGSVYIDTNGDVFVVTDKGYLDIMLEYLSN